MKLLTSGYDAELAGTTTIIGTTTATRAITTAVIHPTGMATTIVLTGTIITMATIVTISTTTAMFTVGTAESQVGTTDHDESRAVKVIFGEVGVSAPKTWIASRR